MGAAKLSGGFIDLPSNSAGPTPTMMIDIGRQEACREERKKLMSQWLMTWLSPDQKEKKKLKKQNFTDIWYLYSLQSI